MEYTVWSLGEGWYDFRDLPPDQKKLVFFEQCNCGTDGEAIKVARRRLGNKGAVIIIKPIREKHSR